MSPNHNGATQLFDPAIERMLVATALRVPAILDELSIAAADLQDPLAREALSAAVNVACRGEVTLPAIREWLQVEYDRKHGPHRAGETKVDLRWLDQLLLTQLPDEPPIREWELAILDLAIARDAAIAEAEPIPITRKTPRGPRAENAEPVRLAEAFRRYSYERDGVPLLVRWARAWWSYDGTRYIERDDELLDRDLIAFLDVVVAPQQVVDKKTGAERSALRRITSRNKTLGEVRKSLLFAMPAISASAPQWISPEDGDPQVESLIVCRNGILDLLHLKLYPSTPRLFATTAVGCSWSPEPAEPFEWFAFLRSLWPDDPESIRELQQIFGYLLTPDTSQQKIFAVIGPPRSGKGTLARILKALLGDEAVVNPTLQSLERPFGLAPLVGKTLAIIGDARLGGASDQQQVVERLLSISGEDSLSIDRKNRDPINVRLRCRVLLLSNELPRLYDTSGALASRFVILTLSRSFLGEEDTQLEAKLLAELPGILKWAIEGRADLQENGKFITPLASEKAAEHLRAISAPLNVFLEECCEMAPTRQCAVDGLYGRYKTWCEENGREASNKQIFGRDLHTLRPDLKMSRPRRSDGGRIRMYEGIGLVRNDFQSAVDRGPQQEF